MPPRNRLLLLVTAVLMAAIQTNAQDSGENGAPTPNDDSMRKRSSTPILADLPILGQLFRSTEAGPIESGGIRIGALRSIETGNDLEQEEEDAGKALAQSDNEPTTFDRLFRGSRRAGNLRDHEALPEPFLRRTQASFLLNNVKGLDSVEIVETRSVRMTRTGSSTQSGFDLAFEGQEEARDKAARLLDKWEAHKNSTVSLQFVLVELDGESPPVSPDYQAIPTAEFDQLVKKYKDDSKATIIHAPKLMVHHGQRASVSVANEIAYVQDFDVEVTANAFIADPVIDVVREGMFLEATPVISLDGKSVRLQMSAAIANVKKPIAVFEFQLASGSKASIQLPEVFNSVRRTDDLILGSDKMAFRLGGLVVMKDDWSKAPKRVVVIGKAEVQPR